ncbi:flagellar protein FlgN [Lysinibacillus sp. CNPSo 3705]|uniref:flagellar protein FlgN n=1 Tax=Lysinibacillus sp. CNPSo 3705 TaxID=3028148 RepID=UPI001046AACB|nr:flagellar protein FlgN [Lysinibacillus sp. CNPSo 3705]MDD1504000.1 flagellar protein FlgN [Lysinibacillus sp. CNPSo 3705]
MSTEAIYSTLTKLERMHKSLLELAIKKTEIITVGNIEALDQMLKDEQAHVAAIDKLEQQRQKQVTDYLEAKGLASTDKATVADVIEAAEQQTEKDTLSAVRNRLLQMINDLKNQNDLNQKLVFQSLQFVNFTLDALQPRPEQINYSGNEVRGTNTVAKKSYFDSQA